MKSPHQPTGYSLDLGGDLHASVHPGGSLTLESPAGAADLSPHQVEQLRALLTLASSLISQSRRRRARSEYTSRYGA